MQEFSRNLIMLLMIWLSTSLITNISAETKKSPEEKKISIYLSHIRSEVKPGDMPLTLSKDLLSKLLPELSNPRLMKLEDLGDDIDAINYGHTIVLRDDFNRDGIADIAFVGKYDNPTAPDKNSFIAIITISGGTVTREFFSKIYRDHISLQRIINYKPKIDAIGMTFNFNSEDCEYLYWSGKQWQSKMCTVED